MAKSWIGQCYLGSDFTLWVSLRCIFITGEKLMAPDLLDGPSTINHDIGTRDKTRIW